MLNFKIGDPVTIYPGGLPGFIKEINLSSTYPIVVNCDGYFEGGYTLEGFRYKHSKYQHTHYIELSNKPKVNNNYWTVVRVNSAFIQLSHPELQDILIPISTLKCIDILDGEPTIISTDYKLPLGPVSIKSVADLLFNNQTNSI